MWGSDSGRGRARSAGAGGAAGGNGTAASAGPAGGAPGGARGAEELPADLLAELERGGYYPQLVADVVLLALAGEAPAAHLVHLETTFDADAVRRHVTVLVLTASRLVTAHVDDHDPTEAGGAPVAVASTESVPLGAVRSVVLGHRVVAPERHRRGAAPQELTLTVGWGTVSRLDLEPAGCSDPDCEADHGYTGAATADDVSLRVSSDADGAEAVRAAQRFARALTVATRPGATAG